MNRALPAILAMAAIAACSPRPAQQAKAPATTDDQSPKAVVNAFNHMAFVDHKPIEATLKYFAPDVKEHDPTTPDGREAIIAYLKRRDWTSTRMQATIHHVIAEGDLVVVHHHVTENPTDPGMAAVDIFRVKDGRIVEHWDVLQPVPKTSANSNTMF